MIGTVETKILQLKNGFYKTGSGKTKILVMGSCRAVAYITYLKELNEDYEIYFIDPFNWNWDMKGERCDYEFELTKMETHNGLLEMLARVDIFIHEYYNNAGMFNVNTDKKNIYEFGLKPSMDITLPNFNDVFLLAGEIVQFDTNIRKQAIADYNVNGKLSDDTLGQINRVKAENLEKLKYIIQNTSLPEFEEYFLGRCKNVRFWWTFNHVTKEYTKALFRMMMEKYFNREVRSLNESDLFSNYYTKLTEYDMEYNWNEERTALKQYL